MGEEGGRGNPTRFHGDEQVAEKGGNGSTAPARLEEDQEE